MINLNNSTLQRYINWGVNLLIPLGFKTNGYKFTGKLLTAKELYDSDEEIFAYAQCRDMGGNWYQIEVLDEFKNAENDFGLREVILHELVHTQPGCYEHDGKFEVWCDKINNKYPQFNILDYSEYQELGFKDYPFFSAYDYVFVCPDCGEMYGSFDVKPDYFDDTTLDVDAYCTECGAQLEVKQFK